MYFYQKIDKSHWMLWSEEEKLKIKDLLYLCFRNIIISNAERLDGRSKEHKNLISGSDKMYLQKGSSRGRKRHFRSLSIVCFFGDGLDGCDREHTVTLRTLIRGLLVTVRENPSWTSLSNKGDLLTCTIIIDKFYLLTCITGKYTEILSSWFSLPCHPQLQGSTCPNHFSPEEKYLGSEF